MLPFSLLPVAGWASMGHSVWSSCITLGDGGCIGEHMLVTVVLAALEGDTGTGEPGLCGSSYKGSNHTPGAPPSQTHRTLSNPQGPPLWGQGFHMWIWGHSVRHREGQCMSSLGGKKAISRRHGTGSSLLSCAVRGVRTEGSIGRRGARQL